MDTPVTPAGWYGDPWFAGNQLRYWDGSTWTGHTAAHPSAPGQSLGRWARWTRRRKVEFKASRQLVDTAYSMLFADRSMIVLMLVGSVLAAVAGLAVLVPSMLWGGVTPSFSFTSDGIVGVLVAAAAFAAATLVAQIAVGTVVAAAVLRAEGTPPTVRMALAVVWSRRRQLLAWAVLSTAVGVVIRILDRIGLGGVIAAVTLNLGWAAASAFAMPVVIVEGTMPLQTLRRSTRVLKDNFGATVWGGVRLAVPWTIALFAAMFVAGGGLFAVVFGGPTAVVIGVVVLAVGVVGTAFCLVVLSSLNAYLQTFLYRYALGRDVPGVDPRLLPPLARPSAS